MQKKLDQKSILVILSFLLIIGILLTLFKVFSPNNGSSTYIDSVSNEEVDTYTGDNSMFFITGINQISDLINSEEIMETLNQFFSVIYKNEEISYKHNSLSIENNNYSFILQSKNETYKVYGVSSGNSYTITVSSNNKEIFKYNN